MLIQNNPTSSLPKWKNSSLGNKNSANQKFGSLKNYFNISKFDISYALGLKFPKSTSLTPTH